MMLRSFRVANHKSIRDEQELLLVPAYDKSRPALPVAAVFGANASGKSNLLDALSFMRSAVRTSFAGWEPGGGVPRRPFRLDPAWTREPSRYAVDLLLGGIRHVYGFAVDDSAVREEWLYIYPHGRKRVIFEREDQQVEFGSTVRELRAGVIAESMRPNVLLLDLAARANQADVQPVYGWFRRGLTWSNQDAENPVASLAKRLAAGGEDASAFVDLMRAADLGIADVQAVDPEESPTDAAARKRLVQLFIERDRVKDVRPGTDWVAAVNGWLDQPSLRFLHGPHAVPMTIADQSEGTRTWLRLVASALDTLDDGSVLVVDEIDSSLHPRLTARLIELFRDERTNIHNGQLLFTTHDATLLGTSFGTEILGRDEVWFVEKDGTGATKLFPLSDFHPRKEENTERRYLGGSYGAVPAVFSGTLVDSLLHARAGRDHVA
jgi:hypothetical protein